VVVKDLQRAWLVQASSREQGRKQLKQQGKGTANQPLLLLLLLLLLAFQNPRSPYPKILMWPKPSQQVPLSRPEMVAALKLPLAAPLAIAVVAVAAPVAPVEKQGMALLLMLVGVRMIRRR
jgi:hypothetical protein